ncbi:MAG: amylo-alpha-1,6-glucosidase [Planctomycetota bacterium]
MFSEIAEVDHLSLVRRSRIDVAIRDDADRDRLADQEWLLTDGFGGFAMGTIAGVPTRRYHGLLTASLVPPLERVLALHSLNEIVWVHPDDPRCFPIDLTEASFVDGTRLTGARAVLERFELFPGGENSVRWTYRVDEGATLIREVQLCEGRSAAVVRYEAHGARMWVDVRPLMGMRGFHGLNHGPDGRARVTHTADGRGLWVARGELESSIEIGPTTAGAFKVSPHWWEGFWYAHEADRGFDASECLFCPGSLHLGLHEPAEVLVTLGPPGEDGDLFDASRRSPGREIRLLSSVAEAMKDGGAEAEDHQIAALVSAADQFVVRRAGSRSLARHDGALVTVIAGYPWFGDWGRDSMIALPGLLLSTGRLAEAGRVLETFAGAQRDGLIPNRFDDDGGDPEYNTADASLWFLHACCEYVAAGGDQGLYRDLLLPACMDVIEAYTDGTRYGIGVDRADGLVRAGDERTQLTWMDAARDGVVFTPRHGKPIELQALWYHGLESIAESVSPWDPVAAGGLRTHAERCGAGINGLFWSDRLGCLVDCLRPTTRGWAPVEEVRPNQLFAASLEHSPLAPERRSAVTRLCRERLWTAGGMRTLDPADPGYHGRYAGLMFERDAAYHTGTAWPWLLGPMAEAVLRSGGFSAHACREARSIVAPMLGEMLGPNAPAPGQMFEVYDGDAADQRPGGCPAQAWSVAEVLRVLLLIRRSESARAD